VRLRVRKCRHRRRHRRGTARRWPPAEAPSRHAAGKYLSLEQLSSAKWRNQGKVAKVCKKSLQTTPLMPDYLILCRKPFSMEQRAFKDVNNCLNTNIYSYSETSGGQSSNP
jgi:hypothetical protein